MKALSCDEPGRLTIVERPEPSMAPGEVLVRIRRVGICGTDYHIFRGNQPYLAYPRIIGHELGGEVVAAPAGSPLVEGRIVAIEPYIYCGECGACRVGKTNCCQRLEVLGVHRDGGACEFIALPERHVVPADGLTVDQAAMVEFLAIGAHGVERAKVGPRHRVLIVGAGPIGIAAAIFCKARGADVSVVDRIERRLAFAIDEVGIDHAFEASDDLAERLRHATDGQFFDIVVDASGNAAAMQAGFAYVGHGGTYLFLSIVRGAITFDDPEFHKRETSLLGSRNATRADFEAVLTAMREGKVPMAALATHHGTLRDAPSLIPSWSESGRGVIKAIVEV